MAAYAPKWNGVSNSITSSAGASSVSLQSYSETSNKRPSEIKIKYKKSSLVMTRDAA